MQNKNGGSGWNFFRLNSFSSIIDQLSRSGSWEQQPEKTNLDFPQIFQLLPTTWGSNSEWALHPFPAVNHGLGLGRADSHSRCFKLGHDCSSASRRSPTDKANRTASLIELNYLNDSKLLHLMIHL